MVDFENILEKALGIAINKLFKVKFYNQIELTVKVKEMTYLELGSFLITNAERIKDIRIYTKE